VYLIGRYYDPRKREGHLGIDPTALLVDRVELSNMKKTFFL